MKKFVVFPVLLSWLFIFSLVFAVKPIQAQATKARYQAYQQLLQQNEFSGSVLLIKHGKTYYRTTQGYSNYQQKQPLTQHSTYQLASLEKAITATLLMKAQEQGKLHLSDPLRKYFPQIPYSANLTLWHLLTMQSGLVMDPENPNVTTQHLQHYLKMHVKVDKKYINRWHYSDVNYILLAQILQRVYHQSFSHLFNRFFKKPLRLHNTNVTADYLANPYHVTAYAVKDQTVNYQIPLTWQWSQIHFERGAGQLYSNPAEFYRLQKAIIQGKIITKSDLRKLRTPTANGLYNGGVYHDVRQHYFYAHGVQQGFDSVVLMSDDAKTAVILFSNRHNANATNFILLAKQFYELMNK